MRQYSLEVRSIGSQREGDEASSCQVRSRRRVTNKSRSIPLHLVYAQSSRVNNVLQLQFRRLRSKASRRGRCYPTPSFASNFHTMALQPLFQGKYTSSNASRIQIQSQCPSPLYAVLLFLSKKKSWLIIPPRRRCYWLLRCTLSTTIAHFSVGLVKNHRTAGGS